MNKYVYIILPLFVHKIPAAKAMIEQFIQQHFTYHNASEIISKTLSQECNGCRRSQGTTNTTKNLNDEWKYNEHCPIWHFIYKTKINQNTL